MMKTLYVQMTYKLRLREKNLMKCDYSVFISKLVSKDTSTSLQNKLIQPN